MGRTVCTQPQYLYKGVLYLTFIRCLIKLAPVLWKPAANTLESTTVYNFNSSDSLMSNPKTPNSAADKAMSVTARCYYRNACFLPVAS